MAFEKRTAPSAMPSDPAQLHRLLSGGVGAPAALWEHQAAVLRTWHKDFATDRDVALELPTGAGKTLVGGLIGEFRRRTARERVVYVCPTRQLARQLRDRLTSYGMPAVLLTGKVRHWNAADRARYTSAQAIAVTVYSHIFNSNSAFSDAQYLILDDAHAAESAVAGPWRIDVPRSSSAYKDLLSTLRAALDPLVVGRLATDTPDGQYQSNVYLASPVGVAAVEADIEQVLRIAADTGSLGSEVTQALRTMQGHLGRCLVYASYASLELRPLIAPTVTHVAFEQAAQRLYMSATLGSGGELERAFGRRVIKRIPAPEGWDKQGTGRRFFCFPELTQDLAADADAADEWIRETISAAGRAVVLTPDGRVAKEVKLGRLPADVDVLEATDVEDDLTMFTGKPKAALVLTNRYDGVDLPDQDCRLVVMQGLPARGDLQERFLYSALGAVEVLQERIRARIVQGAGRATRNSGDWATVLLLGNDLTSFCTRSDVLDALHPDVHAELQFGFDQSLDVTSAAMSENIAVFDAHGAEWRVVESDIVTARDRFERIDPPGARELAAAASYEVEAWAAVWQGEWTKALEHARGAIDALRGGRAPQRYAALWNYLAACWAMQAAEQSGDEAYRTASATYFRAARAAGRGTTWLSHLAAPTDREAERSAPMARDQLDLQAASNIAAALPALGRAGRFEADVTEARSGLLATDAGPYESGLVHLGRLAGADPSFGNNKATAAPDATWIFGESLWVVWEAKSDALPEGELGPTDVRQAGGHLRYVSDARDEPVPSGSPALLVTPQARVHPAAMAVAEAHVHLVRPPQVLDVYDRLARAWRALRARGTDVDAEAVLVALRDEEVLPTQWLERLTAMPVTSWSA